MSSKINIRLGGKRLLMLLALPALALMLLLSLSLSTTGALAGKLTDTSAGLTSLSKQSFAGSGRQTLACERYRLRDPSQAQDDTFS